MPIDDSRSVLPDGPATPTPSRDTETDERAVTPSTSDVPVSWVRRTWSGLSRAMRVVLTVLALVIAVPVVTLFSIDIGPWLKETAERESSEYLNRDVQIGRLSARLLRGQFLLENVVIGGLLPGDEPFFKARRVTMAVPWWTVARRELVVHAVEMRDWQMRVEQQADGRHNFPRFVRRRGEPGPRRFVTTVRVVRATRGEFIYNDHGAPWSVVAPNVDLMLTKTDAYRGTASFSGATVRIGRFEPIWAHMRARFRLDGARVAFERIDLETDGASSRVTGTADLGSWPEQTYSVRSRVELRRMREIFFARDRFTLDGRGDFNGTFHLFKGGREVAGRFGSLDARLNDWSFNALEGDVLWTRDRLVVSNAATGFSGGRAHLDFSMLPLGDPQRPGMARFDARYEDVNLEALLQSRNVQGIRPAGAATGRNRLDWPLGRFAERRGHGEVAVEPRSPTDVEDGGVLATSLGASLRYTFGPERIQFEPGWIGTPDTRVELQGSTAYGDRSEIPFHVASRDWQESDRLLAGVMTALGRPTRAVAVGGAGSFDGVMHGSFDRPRVEGRFTGTRVRAWDVEWGTAEANLVIEHAYADVSGGRVSSGGSSMAVDGRFSLGFPRRDGGEEINARVRVTHRPIADLRHAFELDDYPVDGRLSGEFRLNGKYREPYGFGRMTIDNGVAYGERFESGGAGLRFEGHGVRLDAIELRKSTGRLTGAAFVGWDGSYSFNADARQIPVNAIDAARWPELPLTGELDFASSGSGTFDIPAYTVRGRIANLFIRDEGVGEVSARLAVKGDTMTIAQLEAASPRLTLSGAGRITLDGPRDADLTLRLTGTSLDPYVRLFEPRLSPYTTAIASGTVQIAGPLRSAAGPRVRAAVEDLELRLFEYTLKNDGPIRLTMANQTAHIDRLRLVGEGTTLELFGDVHAGGDRLRVRALGDANLGLLQGVFQDVRSSGTAEVQAEISGSVRAPVIVGSASISNGRLRYFRLPHSLDAVNGRVEFDAGGVRLDNVRGRMGGGEVTVGGRIGIRESAIESYALTATGRDLRLRYPEGFRSQVDTDLALRGKPGDLLLTGAVRVKDALWIKPLDTDGAGIFALAAGGGAAPAASSSKTASFPLRFDLRVEAPGTLRVDDPTFRLVSGADLTLRGTYDRPVLMGRAEVQRGELLLEGHRYLLTRGTIEFSNPARIDPFFDFEAETRARVPGQTYRVVFRASGTRDRFAWDFSSDPPLATVDILGMLFGDLRDPRDAELSALRLRDRTEEELLVARATRLLANPISSEVGKVVRKTFGVDSVQITPSLGELSNLQSARLTPTARLTIGKRISDRIYLVYAQPLTSARPEQLVLIEYTQSDRLAWLVSRNEDETYALDVRVRHVF